MEDTSQVKRQVEALLASLLQRQSKATQDRQQAAQEIERCDNEIAMVGTAIKALQPLKSFYFVVNVHKVEPGTNRKAITSIILDHGGPMKLAEIAKIAFEKAMIRSKKGYKGVYATVSTVLTRNKHFFVHTNELWDLRRTPKTTSGAGLTTMLEDRLKEVLKDSEWPVTTQEAGKRLRLATAKGE